MHYHPFYCEENVWWLCSDPALGPGERHAVFIVSRAGRCPMLEQRVAPRGRLIAWDYHAVAVDAQGRVWDPDTRLILPCPGIRWLDATFALADRLPAVYAPRFRVLSGEPFLAEFASDRRHMRGGGGRYLQPPPPWPPIGQGHRLPRYLNPEAPGPGRLLELAEMRRWLADRSEGARAASDRT